MPLKKFWCDHYSGSIYATDPSDAEFLCWHIGKYWEGSLLETYAGIYSNVKQKPRLLEYTGDLHQSKLVLSLINY